MCFIPLCLVDMQKAKSTKGEMYMMIEGPAGWLFRLHIFFLRAGKDFGGKRND